MNPPGRNWAGNYSYRASTLHEPSTLDDVRRIVARSPQIRVLGSRHSFNAIADSAELISLSRLPSKVAVDRTEMTVSCSGAMTYTELAQALAPHGLALANLASLPHISVAGAIATGTHGSGDVNGNLATAVAALEIVLSSGDVITARRGDDDFDGMVVSVGALGAVTSVTLDVEPTYDVRQVVYRHVPWEPVLDDLAATTGLGYSVSLFTTWGDDIDHVLIKSRVDSDLPWSPPSLFGRRMETSDLHPVAGTSGETCTTQRGVAGPWSDRLAHFRAGSTPSVGDEIQSEFLIPRIHAVAAIEAMRALSPLIQPHLLVSEIRSTAADSLWMSGQYGTDTIGVHYTWRPDPAAVVSALVRIEVALAPFDARPHWGKVFLAGSASIARLYPRHDDFVALAHRLDERGAFRNEWFDRVIG